MTPGPERQLVSSLTLTIGTERVAVRVLVGVSVMDGVMLGGGISLGCISLGGAMGDGVACPRLPAGFAGLAASPPFL